jgi:PST family polysaccharide transporter
MNRSGIDSEKSATSSILTPSLSLFSSVAYFAGVNAIAFLAGVVRQKAFAVYLAPTGVGAFSLAASFFELFTTFAQLGAPVGLLREFTRSLRDENPSRAARVFRDVQRIVVFVAISLGAVLLLLAPSITQYFFGGVVPWWTIPILVAAAPVALSGELRHSAINGLGKTRTLALATVTAVLLGLVATVWLVATLNLAGAILQIAAGALITLFVSQGFLGRIFRLREQNPNRVPPDEARHAVADAFRVGAATASQHLMVTANLFVFRSMIVAHLGTFKNGLYQGTMGLSRQYTASILAGVFVYLYPRLAELAGQPKTFSRELAKSASFALTVIVPISVTLIAIRDWIVWAVFTGEFAPMIPLMAYSFSADVFVVLVGVFRIALLASGRARVYTIAGLVGEGVYLAAFLGGLRMFGLSGATGAYLVAALAELTLYGIVLARRGDFKPQSRLIVQIVLAPFVIGASMISPLGAWTSRVLALALGAAWLGVWRRELVSGFRT